ncbi:MAG TPA: hypothetical protein VGQ57_17235 [Polyangiaceae bacterium]|jgi:MYXO-CTERM domain-containing protein|nr:hypothetical protein [Polyangiaceae bacterium]
MNRRTRLLLRLAALGAALGAAPVALASEPYPANIESYWRLKSLPVAGQGCKLCHLTDPGISGTARQPFATTMIKAGLGPSNVKALQKALDSIRLHAASSPIADSDRDGVPDYTEIVMDHTNPNDARDFKRPPAPVENEGGASGAGAAGGDGAGGSDASGFEPGPSAPGELPPPFVHGCRLGASDRESGAPFAVAALGLALLARRRRRRALQRLTASSTPTPGGRCSSDRRKRRAP